MKFVCEHCNTRYSIPEERVAGKILKIRCKKCGMIITVRGTSQASGVFSGVFESVSGAFVSAQPGTTGITGAASGTEPVPSSVPARPKPEEADWFYTKSGKQAGPVPASEIRELIGSRVIGPKALVWRAGMIDWVRIGKVPEFEDAVREASPAAEEAAPPAAPKVAEPAGVDAGRVFDKLLGHIHEDYSQVKKAKRPDAFQPAAEPAPAPRLEIKPEPKPESKPKLEPKPEPVQEPKPEPEAVIAHEKAAGPVAEAVQEPKPGLEPVAASEPSGATEPPGAAPDSTIDQAGGDAASSGAFYVSGVTVEETEFKLADEAKEQRLLLLDRIRASEEKRAREEEAAEAVEESPRENTRIVILKAGLSKRSKIKRYLVAALVLVGCLSAFAWILAKTSAYDKLKSLSFHSVKYDEGKMMNTPAGGKLTPEEEAYRKSLLGIKDPVEREKAARRFNAAKKDQPAVPDTSALQDAYAGIAKGDPFSGRIELSGALSEPGIGSLGGAGVKSEGFGMEKKAGLIDLGPAQGGVSGGISEAEVQRIISLNMTYWRTCYERFLKSDSSLSGKVFFQVEIEPGGKVSSARSMTDRIKGTDYESCMLKAIKKVQFPKASVKTTVELPFVLTSTM